MDIHLAHNENPYGPGPAALEAIRAMAARGHRYPGMLATDLIATISAHHDVPTDHVLLSGGSGDVMRAAVYTYTDRLKPLVTARPSYEAPMRSAQHIGAPVVRVPLTPSLTLDTVRMAAASVGAGLVYICSPNNPSATAVPVTALRAMMARVVALSPRTRFLVDEAYCDYADLEGFGTIIPLVHEYRQVIVTRTFSKIHGLAGMRVAYAIAHPETLDEFRPRHSRSSLSALSMAAAEASLNDQQHLTEIKQLNRGVRAGMVTGFTEAGYRVARADANFIFVDVRRDARLFQQACAARGIHIGRAFPPLGQWARISVGTEDEMQHAMPILLDVLLQHPDRATTRDSARPTK